MKRLISGILMVCLTQAVTAQELQPVKDAMTLVKREMARQCATGRQQLASAEEGFQKEQAASMTQVACDCMPRELERVEMDLSGGDPEATTTRDAFLSRMHAAVSTCTAQFARLEVGNRCERETEATLGVKNKATYCKCVSAGVAELDDATIVEASTTALQHFRRKQQAKALGSEEPAPTPTAIDAIMERCKQDEPRS